MKISWWGDFETALGAATEPVRFWRRFGAWYSFGRLMGGSRGRSAWIALKSAWALR